MTTRLVLAPSAPSQASEFGAWPFVCFQGWKWSLTNTESKPTSSARQEKSNNSRGPNCSAEALYPSFSTSLLLSINQPGEFLSAVPAKAGTHWSDHRAVRRMYPGFRRECGWLGTFLSLVTVGKKFASHL